MTRRSYAGGDRTSTVAVSTNQLTMKIGPEGVFADHARAMRRIVRTRITTDLAMTGRIGMPIVITAVINLSGGIRSPIAKNGPTAIFADRSTSLGSIKHR